MAGSMVDEKSNAFPSAVKPPKDWGLSEAVTRRAVPPTKPAEDRLTGITYRFLAPSRLDSKARRLPSAEKADRRSSAGWTVRREHTPPSIGADHRSPAQAKTTTFPSGLRLGNSGKPTAHELSAPGKTPEGAGGSVTVMGAGVARQP